MLENRSFFRIFGRLDPKKDEYINHDWKGTAIKSGPTRKAETLDPPHEILPVLSSISGHKMNGFVKEYERYAAQYHSKDLSEDQKKDLMGYYEKGFLPVVEQLQKCGTVCDRWFSSLPGPTWPNRMYAYAGTSLGWTYTPDSNSAGAWDLLTKWSKYHCPKDQDNSIHVTLTNSGKKSAIYHTNGAWTSCISSLLYSNYSPKHVQSMEDLDRKSKAGELENFCWIEPDYTSDPNDDHPPHDAMKAQALIAKVYNILRAGKNWDKTMFIVTYDEHGGFFDPVAPPSAPVPDVHSNNDPAFASYGIRVPSIIISPCVKQGFDSTQYDHTSVLKYMLSKWAPDKIHKLGQRVAQAKTFPTLSQPRPLTEFEEIKIPAFKATAITAEDERFQKLFKEKIDQVKHEFYPQADDVLTAESKAFCKLMPLPHDTFRFFALPVEQKEKVERVSKVAYARAMLDYKQDWNDLQKGIFYMTEAVYNPHPKPDEPRDYPRI